MGVFFFRLLSVTGTSLKSGSEPVCLSRVAALLEDFATSLHATLGYVTVEAPPPTTRGELAAECEQRELAWIDGVIDRSRR